MAKLFQYPALAQPLEPIAPPPETITLDKWQGSAEPIIRAAKGVATLVSSIAFVAVTTVVATPVYAGGSNCEPTAVQSYQYQAKAEPVLVPSAPEDPSPVYAGGQNCEPIAKKRYQYQAKAEPVLVPTVVEDPSPVFVSGQNCEPIAKRKFQYQSKAEPVSLEAGAPPETITLDKWAQPTEAPYPARIRARELGRVAATRFEPGAPAETVTLDKWSQPAQLPIRQPKRLVVLGVNAAVAEEQIYSDVVFHPASIPQFKQAVFRDYVLSTKNLITPAAVVTTPVYVGAQNPEPTQIVQFQYPGRTQPVLPIAGASETVTLDKWSQPSQLPIRKPRQLTVKGVNTAVAEEQIYSDTLFQQSIQPYPYRKNARLIEGTRSTFTPASVAETLTLDKWGQPTSKPQFDLRRNQYLFPTFASSPNTTFAETATLDKWGQPIQQPIFDKKRTQQRFPTVVSDYLSQVPAAEVIRLDKWTQPTNQPRFTKKNTTYTYVTFMPGDLTAGSPVVIVVRSRRTFGPHVGRRQIMESD